MTTERAGWCHILQAALEDARRGLKVVARPFLRLTRLVSQAGQVESVRQLLKSSEAEVSHRNSRVAGVPDNPVRLLHLSHDAALMCCLDPQCGADQIYSGSLAIRAHTPRRRSR